MPNSPEGFDPRSRALVRKYWPSPEFAEEVREAAQLVRRFPLISRRIYQLINSLTRNKSPQETDNTVRQIRRLSEELHSDSGSKR